MRLPYVCLLLVLLASCDDRKRVEWKETEASSEVKRGLEAFLDGKLSSGLLQIRYTDLHPIHGGLEIVVSGAGAVRQKARRTKVSAASDLTVAEMKELVRLLVRIKAWQQRVPDRKSTMSDESKAYLTITVGSSKTHTWEWYLSMGSYNRLIRVKDLLKRLAWKR